MPIKPFSGVSRVREKPAKGPRITRRGASASRLSFRVQLDFSFGRCYRAAVKKLSIALVIVLLAAVTAHAASLSGTWNAKVDLGGQGGTPTFVLKQEGDKLTGTYAGALGEAPVTGTVKGSEVTFDFEVQGAKVHYAGKLNADGTQIEGTCDYGGQASGTFTATKRAEKK